MKTAFKLALGVVHIFAIAWVMAQLWGWFAVPLGVPPIGMAHAYGLIGMISYPFIPLFARMATNEDADKVPIIALALTVDAIAYLSGAAAHWFMVSA